MKLDDIDIIERNTPVDEATFYETLQRAINEGEAWRFQGSYGRAMMAAIEAGFCMLGESPAQDAYGSPIPSRSEVKPGAKGSREFVVTLRGEEWAMRMESQSPANRD